MTTVFHARPYGRFIEIQNIVRRKKVHRTSQDSNFLGDSFSNRDNIRVPNQFRRERQPQLHKRLFFLKNRPINFHIKQKSLVFPVLQSASHFLPPVHSVSQIRFKFSNHLQLLLQIRCLIALKAESSIVRANSNITDTIIRKAISIQQEKCRTNNGALRNSYVLILKKNVTYEDRD